MKNQIAKMMPYSVESEQSVLCCMLINNEVVAKIASKLTEDDFYQKSHQVIFNSMLSLYADNKPIDFVTVTDKLETINALDSVGGIEYITTLANFLPSAVNYNVYVEIVKRNAINRELINISQKIAEKAYNNDDGDETLSYAEGLIYNLAQNEQSTDLEQIVSSLNMAIKNMDEIAKNGGKIKGISTSIKEFDQLTNGLQNSDLILLAARPGVGKTSFALNIAINAAIEQNKCCAIFSLEMPRIQLAQRAICYVAKVSMSKAKKRNFNSR